MVPRIVQDIHAIAPAAWNALVAAPYPFLRHEFLSALEDTGCVGARTGWLPQHLVLHADDDPAGALLGAVPMYLKSHSYGEYVFDWAWANAHARAGIAYYPKLVAAVPFTPIAGPRLLVRAGAHQAEIADRLIRAAHAHARAGDVSSLHWLFTDATDTARLEQQGFQRRIGSQFHWCNHGYRDFDDFLARFAADKRKKIKRERRRVAEAGVVLEVRDGGSLRDEHLDRFYAFYTATIQNHGAIPYLNRAFFVELGRRMPDNVVLIFARHGNEYVAGAFFLRGGAALYGRYWGSLRDFHGLHFETCYYRAIEYCIAEGIARFEGGAQGEFKLARGLVPTPTYSAHWLRHPELARAVAEFLARERHGVAYHMEELKEHLPFRQGQDV